MVAMQDEMKFLYKNNTFKLVWETQKKKVLKNKWVCKIKLEDGNPKPIYKARLVVKRFGQTHSVDYDGIFSLAVKVTSIRVISGLATTMNLEVEQLDVKMAFYHGDLEKDVYLDKLEGFQLKGKESKVCKLMKSLYGLKQAPWQWYIKLKVFHDNAWVQEDFARSSCVCSKVWPHDFI